MEPYRQRTASTVLATLLLALAACASPPPPRAPVAVPSPDTSRADIAALNAALLDATTRMDNAATLALWADDGVSLLPSTKPIVGKQALGAFLDQVMASLPGARMKSFEMRCDGLVIAGDLATEYCDEHQVVELGGGKPPFDGRGKMLLVLRRGEDRRWKISREMWNQGLAAP